MPIETSMKNGTPAQAGALRRAGMPAKLGMSAKLGLVAKLGMSAKLGLAAMLAVSVMPGFFLLAGCGGGNRMAASLGASVDVPVSARDGSPRDGALRDGTGALAVQAAVVRQDAPRPEAAASLPAIRGGADEALLVYRFTDHRFLQAYGYDTLVYRFLTLPGGWISGAIVSERGLGGEKDVAAWNFPRAGSTTYLHEKPFTQSSGASPMDAPRRAALDIKDGIARLDERGVIRSYSRQADGSLRVWGAEPGDPPGSVSGYTIADWSRGEYAPGGRNPVTYKAPVDGDAEGQASLEASVWAEKEGVLRYRVEGIEAICEVYASGLVPIMKGERGLENLAIIEAVTGTAKPLRPLLEVAAGMARR